MASALMILFLGCWLAGQSGVSGQSGESGQLPAPGPSISVSPSGVIVLGRAVTIRCQCRCEARTLLLYKDGIEIWALDAAGDGGEFTIPSARRKDRGAYSCRSRSGSEPPDWSYPSNIVQITVADPSLPRPSISLSLIWLNALRANATIRCQGQRRDVRFFLHKAGDLNQQRHTDPAGAGAEFRIPSVGRRHGGSYSCSYRPRSEPFVSSYVSSSVELVVAGGTDSIHPGVSPAPTCPGSAGPAGPPPERLDFTKANIACLVLGAVVLLVLGLILVEAYYSCLRETS
ncbi:immunoglobulin superfamily member 1-like [Gopherus evgoodei]|uniref:immunoglobulin superfamily member 1-like n=1 Tax=Gopherus evgoodei TaxID=1825980 RepID=UPI0011CFD484|nr:immunoglobulin superfamily member 1-like [Gopherus evgoodei]